MSQHEDPRGPLHLVAPPGQSPWSSRRRATRGGLPSTLLVGHPDGIGALHEQLRRQPLRDYRVIGCCLPVPAAAGETVEGLPVLGGPDDVVDVVWRYAVDTVAVIPSAGWDGTALRRLERDLRPTPAHLLLAPAGTDAPCSRPVKPPVGQQPPRTHRRGLHGMRALIKASFDRAVAALLVLLLAPVLLAVALGVKATSRGPVFVRLERVGRDGRLFHLLKFRTTEARAERRVDELTPLGCLLRRSSLDELPQLLNVLRGDMSIVGPRPGLPSEVAPSGAPAQGRSPVKPGLTGLAHLSGVPERPWGDRARIDTDYVENWSLLLDLAILRRTLAAVLRRGATM